MLFISKVYTHPALLEKPINNMLLGQNYYRSAFTQAGGSCDNTVVAVHTLNWCWLKKLLVFLTL